MNKKRILLTVLAMVLVCVLSVAGTLALLTAHTDAVTNTFVAAAGSDNPFVDKDGFSIKEYKVGPDAAGNYNYVDEEGNKLAEDAAKIEVAKNTYKVVPGVTLPKDAFVKLSRANETPAYLFIEVDNNLDTSVFSMSVDTTVWGKLDGVTGKNGGDIYVLGTADAPTVLGTVTAADGVYHIIAGNKVTVANTNDLKITTSTADTIKFYAYICQATVAKADGNNTSNPAEVFNICF